MQLRGFLWSQVFGFKVESVNIDQLKAASEAFQERYAIAAAQDDCSPEISIKAALKSAKSVLKTEKVRLNSNNQKSIPMNPVTDSN